MMHQSLQSSIRKNRNKKINKALSQQNLDLNSPPSFIPHFVKRPISYLVSLFRFGFVLLIWEKVFHSLQSVKNKTISQYSRLSLYRMVSQDYRGSNAMASKSSTSQTAKPTSTLQPTRLEVDPETVLKYKKKIENLTEEERLVEFNREKTLGNECYNKSRYEAAMHHYTYCILSQPHSIVGYTNRAAAYLRMNKYSQVLEDCNEALKIDPNHSKAKYRRGLALHHKNFFREALQDFEDVVRSERNIEGSQSSATAKHYVSKIRELLYTQPREIRLLVNDINGNSGGGGEGDNMGPHVIQVLEKDYRFNPKYQRCVPINEWGFAKAWCKCHNGEPEFLRSFNRELSEKRKNRKGLPPGENSGKTQFASQRSEVVLPKFCAGDQSVNILAKGLMRSLSSDKSGTIATADKTSSQAKRSSILEATLRPVDSETHATNKPIPSTDASMENASIPQVPCIRSMPLLDDDCQVSNQESVKTEAGVSDSTSVEDVATEEKEDSTSVEDVATVVKEDSTSVEDVTTVENEVQSTRNVSSIDENLTVVTNAIIEADNMGGRNLRGKSYECEADNMGGRNLRRKSYECEVDNMGGRNLRRKSFECEEIYSPLNVKRSAGDSSSIVPTVVEPAPDVSCSNSDPTVSGNISRASERTGGASNYSKWNATSVSDDITSSGAGPVHTHPCLSDKFTSRTKDLDLIQRDESQIETLKPNVISRSTHKSEAPGNLNYTKQEVPGNSNYKKQEVPGNVDDVKTEVPGNSNYKKQEVPGKLNYSKQEIPGNSNYMKKEVPGNSNYKKQEVPGKLNYTKQEVPGNLKYIKQDEVSCNLNYTKQEIPGNLNYTQQEIPGNLKYINQDDSGNLNYINQESKNLNESGFESGDYSEVNASELATNRNALDEKLSNKSMSSVGSVESEEKLTTTIPDYPAENGPKKPARKYVKLSSETKTKAQLDSHTEFSQMNGHSKEVEAKVNGLDFNGRDSESIDINDVETVNGISHDSPELVVKALSKSNRRHMRRTQKKKQTQRKEEEDVAS